MCGFESFWESMDDFGMKEFGVSGDKPVGLGLEALCFFSSVCSYVELVNCQLLGLTFR